MFKLKRVGTQPVKVLFTLDVQSVYFPSAKDSDLSIRVPVSVCFERGGKMVCSGEHETVKANEKDLLVEINETLRLVVTLYRTGNNLYQEKTGKIVVRQRRSGDKLKSSNAFKGIGTVKIQLNVLARSFDSCRMTLALEQCAIAGAVVNATVTAKVMGDADDDTMSQISGTTDMSCEAADFSESFAAGAGIVLYDTALGGIKEETDTELLGEERSSQIGGLFQERESDVGRSTEIFDRILNSADVSTIGVAYSNSPLLRSIDKQTVQQSSEIPPSRRFLEQEAEIDEERKRDLRTTFSLQNGVPFISQDAYDDKIKDILKLRGQLDQCVGDLSRSESKLITANMLIDAETKRSKKLKEELLEVRKEKEALNHKINVLERSKSLQEDKLKAMEGDNERVQLMLTTQRHLTDAVSERRDESVIAFKGVLDQKVELESVKDQLLNVTNDRDTYKSEVEQTRQELLFLQDHLAGLGINIPPEEERYEEDKDNVISALRSQLSSLQIIAEEEKSTLSRRLDMAEAKLEKAKLHSTAREAELKKAGIHALSLAKEAWAAERIHFEKKLASAEADIRDLINDIDVLRQQLRDTESKAISAAMEREAPPSPQPSKPADGPAPMLRQLSKMKSMKAFTSSSKNISVESESDEHQRQIDSLTASHNTATSVLSKELDTLRTRISLLESELDSADHRFEAIQHELKLTKMELWETLDKVDNNKPAATQRRESLRLGANNSIPLDADAALLDELITVKMDHATLATIRDLDRLETFALKRRVQGYAERVANLEVQLALSNEKLCAQ